MSEAQVYNISIHQGEYWQMSHQLTDDNDVPINLTGYHVEMEIRSAPGGQLYKHLDDGTGNGITITPGTGTILFEIESADTEAFVFDFAVYDIKITDPDSKPTYPLKGAVLLTKRVTE